jgi:hypothetical protein
MDLDMKAAGNGGRGEELVEVLKRDNIEYGYILSCFSFQIKRVW